MSHIIGGKLFKVEDETLSDHNPQLLSKVRAAMDRVEFCNECKTFAGEMALYIEGVLVRIDWTDRTITIMDPE